MTREEYAARLAKIGDFYGAELRRMSTSMFACGQSVDLMGSDPVGMRVENLTHDAAKLAKLATQMSKDLAKAEKEFKQP